MARRRKLSKQMTKSRSLITNINPRSPISEQYRTIRTNLQFSAVDTELQTMLFTSSGASEGKSTTVANVAVVYAQQGKRVLLIDADLRKPTVHYSFRVDNVRGLSNLLVDNIPFDDVVHETNIENLHVVTCGPIPPNPSELLASKKMDSMIEELKKVYDVILIDSPPVLAVTDAQILSALVDGVVLVVRSKETEIEAAQKAVELLQASKAKILGAILNGQDKKNSNNYYYYYGQ